MSKINQMLTHWESGDVHGMKWLAHFGISQQLVHKYSSGAYPYLVRVGKGLYKRANDKKVNWASCLKALQFELKLPILLSSKTALDAQGLAHNLSTHYKTVYLRSYEKGRLPQWFKDEAKEVEVNFKTSSLFSKEVPHGYMNVEGSEVKISSREVAILELIDDASLGTSFEEVKHYMESLTTLQSAKIQFLLETCNSIKVKRVFLFMSDYLSMPYFKKLNIDKVDLGSGKREVFKGGRFDKKYRITVPPEMVKR